MDAVLTNTVPFVKDVLDTPDTKALMTKLIFLVIGIAIYAALTATICKKSIQNFEKQDLN